MGSNYLSLPEITASGTKVLIYVPPSLSVMKLNEKVMFYSKKMCFWVPAALRGQVIEEEVLYIEAKTKWAQFWHFQINFLYGNCCIFIQISQTFVLMGPVESLSALVSIMAWCWEGQKGFYNIKLLIHDIPLLIFFASHTRIRSRSCTLN